MPAQFQHGAQHPKRSNPLTEAVEQRDRATMQMVHNAIYNSHVLLAFQPVVTAQDPGRIAFYEGLVRVLDDTGRVIPAVEFIEVIESTPLGRQIDCLSLKIGLETLAQVPGLRLSINMSAQSIANKKWMSILRKGLKLSPTVGERLILEITESSAMDMPEQVIDFMDELQLQSISFALDDFGAGYTSFRYLRDFFFDIIKVDGSFVRGIHKDLDNQVLAQALLSIGNHFEMFTVAECVEGPEDAEFLRSIGFDCLQGYLYGAPTTRPSWVSQEDGRKAG